MTFPQPANNLSVSPDPSISNKGITPKHRQTTTTIKNVSTHRINHVIMSHLNGQTPILRTTQNGPKNGDHLSLVAWQTLGTKCL